MSRALIGLAFWLAACQSSPSSPPGVDPDGGSSPDAAPDAADLGLAIEPAAITLPAGTDQYFVATPTATGWSVVEPGGGSIDASGRYLAPDVPGTYHVTASDGVRGATAVVTVVQMSLAVLTGGLGGTGTIDGTGAHARFYVPYGIALDGNGHAFVSDAATIRSLELATGVVTTLAGGSPGHSPVAVDGVGADARFVIPRAMAFDATHQILYIADQYDHTIRTLDVATHTVTTVAGQHTVVGTADGIGTAATFSYTSGLCLRGTTLYITDQSTNTIRTMDTITHEVKLLAGLTGTAGYANSTDPLAARFAQPIGVACGAATVYVADYGNGAIRTIDPSGSVATLVGGTQGVPSTDGSFATAGLPSPYNLALDPTESVLYVTHRVAPTGKFQVRALDLVHQQTSTIPLAPGVVPFGVTTTGTAMVLTDFTNTEVLSVDLATHAVASLAGKSRSSDAGSIDGEFADARFTQPQHLAAVGNDVFVTDTDATGGRGAIRKLSLTAGTTALYAGQGGSTPLQDGPRDRAVFDPINGIAVSPDGLLWATDPYTAVRAVDAAGTVTTPYGVLYSATANPPAMGHVDGVGNAARFFDPGGIVALGNQLIVTDVVSGTAYLRAIDRSTGMVSTIADATFEAPWGLASDGDHLVWVTDGVANTIRQVDVTTGAVTTLAGEPDVAGESDGIGSAAHFDAPLALAYDGHGSLYIADSGGQTIRRMWLATRAVSTIAGKPYQMGVRPGPLQTATLSSPGALAITPTGTLLVTGEEAVLAIVTE